jgi:putative SOS response-associated peptidase YedK
VGFAIRDNEAATKTSIFLNAYRDYGPIAGVLPFAPNIAQLDARGLIRKGRPMSQFPNISRLALLAAAALLATAVGTKPLYAMGGDENPAPPAPKVEKKTDGHKKTGTTRSKKKQKKPMFRSAFKRHRSLIPASGYYEWQSTPTGKQPYYYTARDGSPLTIAGLWDEWKDIETGEPLKSCTMLVTNANKLAIKIHDRMPVLLQPKDFDRWLDGTAGTELLKPAPNDYLQVWPVSRRVNSSRAAGDDPALIDRVAA